MVTITVEEVRERFPEFSDSTLYTDSTIDSTIVLAELWIDPSPSIKDNLARQLLFFLTAHFIVFAKKAQNGNFDSVLPVTAKNLGPAGLSYQALEANSMLKSFLISTNYGEQYLGFLSMWRLKNRIAFNLIG